MCQNQNIENITSLVLNADYRPLSVVPLSTMHWHEVIKAVVQDRVVVIENYDINVHSANLTMPMPSVIAMREYVPVANVPAAFTRDNVFLRDGYCCQYCGSRFYRSQLTYDHVTPKSRGGPTSWENIVTACGPCNLRKGDKHAGEVGMKLLSRPFAPTKHELNIRGRRFVLAEQVKHASWHNYIAV